MLDSSTSIIYIILLIIFLEGCSNNGIRGSYNKYTLQYTVPGITICISQDKSINTWYQKKVLNVVAHKYHNMNHNSYYGVTYIVKPGDTLFYIAWITGNNYLDLAKINNIKDINILKVGQVLQVNNYSELSYFQKILKKFRIFFGIGKDLVKKMYFFVEKQRISSRAHNYIYRDMNTSYHNSINDSKISGLIAFKNWYWPTDGKIVNVFSDSERGNKGIDISGVLGQPILAAASGKVVYAGNTLQGYGNLIIIKHGYNYLSAYAHNDIILVTEQQNVKIGDKIATMGNSGTNEVKLHFEIRYKGKSVNPLYYLPK